jgi:hypothetical protein
MDAGRITSERHEWRLTVVVLVGVSILAAAAVAGPRDRRSANEFDPLGFPGDDSVVTVGVGARPVDTLSTMRAETLAVSSDSLPVAVWRVQFYATSDLAEAEDLRERAAAALADTVTVEFETPYYKVSAGRFTDRDAAEALVVKLRAMGYESAWIVRGRGTAGER